MGFYRVDGYAQLFGNFIDGQSIYAQPDDLTLFGRIPDRFPASTGSDAWIYTFRGVTTSSTDYKQPGKGNWSARLSEEIFVLRSKHTTKCPAPNLRQ